jgi:hypothetical protein
MPVNFVELDWDFAPWSLVPKASGLWDLVLWELVLLTLGGDDGQL